MLAGAKPRNHCSVAAADTVQAVIDRTEPPKRQKNLAAVTQLSDAWAG